MSRNKLVVASAIRVLYTYKEPQKSNWKDEINPVDVECTCTAPAPETSGLLVYIFIKRKQDGACCRIEIAGRNCFGVGSCREDNTFILEIRLTVYTEKKLQKSLQF